MGHMDIELTFDDPKAYTKPWKACRDPGNWRQTRS